MRHRAKAPTAFLCALVLAVTVSLGAASALADTPPAVTIDPPGAASYTTAQVSGTVNPQGGPSETSWHFEYSTDPGPGSWEHAGSASGSIGGAEAEGTSPIAVEGQLEGLQPDTTYSVRLVAENEEGVNQVATVAPYPTLTTLAVTPFSVSIAQASGVTATAAELSGEVDPGGSDGAFGTSWEFKCTPECPGSASESLNGLIVPDGSSHPVARTANELQPNTEYEVTLVAENLGGSASAGPIAFKTTAIPPEAATLPTFALEGGTRALLGARVNPFNQPTTYWFEYGSDDSYGATLPASEEGDAGSGGQYVYPTQQLAGLAPETTYHYRVVARNATGTTLGADRAFTTGPAPVGPPAEDCPNAEIRNRQSSNVLPECRAWEMATPVDKNNLDAGGAEYFVSYIQSSESGNQFLYFSDGAFGDAQSSQIGNPYLATRGADWTSTGIQAPVSVSTFFGNANIFSGFLSKDMRKTVITVTKPALTPDSPAEYPNIYVKDLSTGTYDLVTVEAPLNAPGDNQALWPLVAGVSADYSKVLFYSGYAYTPDAPTAVGNNYNLYEWDADTDRLELVGRLPDGSVAPTGAYLGGGSNGVAGGTSDHAISEDGSRVFYNLPSELGKTYLRENGSPAKQVSSGEFWTATPTGSKALFTANGRVQLYDVESETTTDLSPDENPTDGSSPRVLGITANSADLSTVYFVAQGSLVAGVEASGEYGLYVSNDGEVEYIGDVGQGTAAAISYSGDYPLKANALTTANGDQLAFVSGTRMTAYDNNGFKEVYLYDNTSGELRCPSCRQSGTPSQSLSLLRGSAFSSRNFSFGALKAPLSNFSADGSRLFFQSADALSPDDTNGTNDVYMWKDGTVELLSSGVGAAFEGHLFMGASPSGSSVFFSTRNRIAGIDTDELTDVYIARVGGGIASQAGVAAVAPCLGEQCRGPASAPPEEAPPVSRDVTGSRNATPKKAKPKCKKGFVKKRGKCVKRGKKNQRRTRG